MLYLPPHCFTAAFTFQDRLSFCQKYSDPEWTNAIDHIRQDRQMISKNAIRLAEKVLTDTNIELFPLVISLAVKGYASSGQVKFMMIDKYARHYYFNDPIKECLLKRNKIKEGDDGIDNEMHAIKKI